MPPAAALLLVSATLMALAILDQRLPAVPEKERSREGTLEVMP